MYFPESKLNHNAVRFCGVPLFSLFDGFLIVLG